LTTTIQNSPHPTAGSRPQPSHRITDVRQPLHTCHQHRGLHPVANDMIQSNDSSFVSPSIASPLARTAKLDKRYLRNRARSRLTARPKPTASDTFHEDAIYYNNQIVKDLRAAVWLSQIATAHWVGAHFARQNRLATSDSVKPRGKKQGYENRPEVSMRGPSDSRWG